jgi:hypothetical protein
MYTNVKKMSYELVIWWKDCKRAVRAVEETFKSLHVWKVVFEDGEEAVLFKCGAEWFQRNEDGLELRLLKAIGQKIDIFAWGSRFPESMTA